MSNKINSENEKTSVTLSQDEAQTLEWLATEQGVTRKEALRRAIATEVYFYKERKVKSKIVFYTKDGKIKEALFR